MEALAKKQAAITPTAPKEICFAISSLKTQESVPKIRAPIRVKAWNGVEERISRSFVFFYVVAGVGENFWGWPMHRLII